MAYRVTAPHGVYVMLPTGMIIGRRQIHENMRFPQGFTLPDGIKPRVLANLVDSGLIEEVAEELLPGVEPPVA